MNAIHSFQLWVKRYLPVCLFNKIVSLLLSIMLVLGIIAQFSYASIESDGLILFTFYHNEKNITRILEFTECIERNLNHPLIKKIVVLYDYSKDDKAHPENNYMWNYLISKPAITIKRIVGRPTFGDFFKLANNAYPNARVIIANGDIYFNDTLQGIIGYDLTDTFVALTRWDVCDDNSLEYGRHRYSSDVWIFDTPLKKFKKDDVMLGVLGCDPEIICCALESGLKVINPDKSIQSCHLDITEARNYNRKAVYTRAPDPLIPHTALQKKY